MRLSVPTEIGADEGLSVGAALGVSEGLVDGAAVGFLVATEFFA
jgi:hypothetical protein